MKLSIVTTLYYSSPYLQAFYQSSCQTVASITSDYEIILVNDGSPDDALAVALALHEQDSRVTVIDLSRNFGHHQAIMTGLAQAQGDLIFLIDSDLEESPELLSPFYEKMQATAADVVYGVQKQRQDSIVNKLTSKGFYYLFNRLSTYPIPENVLTVRLMTARYVHALLQHRETHFVIAVLWQMTGYQQVSVEVQKSFKGKTTYHLGRKIAHVINSVTASTNKPLVYVAYLGVFMVIPSGLFILYILMRFIIFGIAVSGWLSLIVSIWFLGGFNVFILGIISIYLSVIFDEVKNRPSTIIRQIYRRDDRL